MKKIYVFSIAIIAAISNMFLIICFCWQQQGINVIKSVNHSLLKTIILILGGISLITIYGYVAIKIIRKSIKI